MQQVFFLSLILITVAVGCSSKSKYVRSEFEKKIGAVQPRFEEKDIQKNFEKKVNLPKPFSIAVYFKDPSMRHDDQAWRWDLKEKEAFVKKLRDSTDRKLVNNVFLMNESVGEDNKDLYDVRLAASKYGADSVLVVQAATDTVRDRTRWASSYILILPALFVNGNKADTYFGINASLWDVRSEMLYLSMSSEGQESDVYPAMWFKSDGEYIEKTKEIALNNMMTNMSEDFSSLNSQQSTQ